MNNFPDVLYKEHQRDPALPFRWFQWQQQLGVAQVSFNHDFLTVPFGYDFMMHSWVHRFIGGAAQTLSEFYIDWQRAPGEGTRYDVWGRNAGGVLTGITGYQDWQGAQYFPFNSVVRATATFSGGAAVNVSGFWVTGILIPQTEILG